MGEMNWKRIVLGGLVAGLVINIFEFTSQVVFADWYAELFESLSLPAMGGGDMAVLVIGGFVIGIIGLYVYAGMRSRFGPGPMTALRVGAIVWFLGWFWQMVVDVATGIYDPGLRMWVVGSVWTLVEVELAILAGASLYKDKVVVPAAP